MVADAPAAGGVGIGLTGVGVAGPAPPFAPEPPLETLPGSTTMAAPVDPDLGVGEVPDETDGEVSAGATAEADVGVAAVAAAEPEAEVAEPEPVEPEPVKLEAVEPEAVEPAVVEPEAVEPEPVVPAEPVLDVQDAAAVALPACEDAAAAAHWDDTGRLVAPPDAVAPSAASLAPVEPSVAAWATVLASVSTVVAASVAHAATPAGTVAAEEHVGVVGEALSARARAQLDHSTKPAATNANHHAECRHRRIDVPSKAPLRRLMSMSPSDANVKKKQLAISHTAPTRASKAANHYLAEVLPLSAEL